LIVSPRGLPSKLRLQAEGAEAATKEAAAVAAAAAAEAEVVDS
jgi:hypothetical protein